MIIQPVQRETDCRGGADIRRDDEATAGHCDSGLHHAGQRLASYKLEIGPKDAVASGSQVEDVNSIPSTESNRVGLRVFPRPLAEAPEGSDETSILPEDLWERGAAFRSDDEEPAA